jgi:hypothetical protein
MSSKVEKPIYNQLTITEIKSRTRPGTEVTDIPPRKYGEWTENSRIEAFNTVYLEMDRLAEQLRGMQRRPEAAAGAAAWAAARAARRVKWDCGCNTDPVKPTTN